MTPASARTWGVTPLRAHRGSSTWRMYQSTPPPPTASYEPSRSPLVSACPNAVVLVACRQPVGVGRQPPTARLHPSRTPTNAAATVRYFCGCARISSGSQRCTAMLQRGRHWHLFKYPRTDPRAVRTRVTWRAVRRTRACVARGVACVLPGLNPSSGLCHCMLPKPAVSGVDHEPEDRMRSSARSSSISCLASHPWKYGSWHTHAAPPVTTERRRALDSRGEGEGGAQ